MILLNDNKILTSTITANSEDPNYPLSNLLDTRVVKYYRSISDSALRIVFENTGTAADWFFILNHNITSGATIKLEANTNDSWGSPPFSEVITHNSGTMSLNFTEATYDFWSLYVDDSSNPNDFIQIGLCSLGAVYEMPGAESIEVILTDTSVENVSLSGQLTGDERYKFRGVSATFTGVEQTVSSEIREIYSTLRTIRPFVMCVWENSLDIESPIYSRFVNKTLPLKQRPQQGLIFDFSLEFEEVF